MQYAIKPQSNETQYFYRHSISGRRTQVKPINNGYYTFDSVAMPSLRCTSLFCNRIAPSMCSYILAHFGVRACLELVRTILCDINWYNGCNCGRKPAPICKRIHYGGQSVNIILWTFAMRGWLKPHRLQWILARVSYRRVIRALRSPDSTQRRQCVRSQGTQFRAM